MKLNRKIIHDDEAVREVFYRAKAWIEIYRERLEIETKQGYCIRKGIRIEGTGYKNEIKKMKVKLETLTELFSGQECIKYEIKEDEDEYEMEI